MYSYEDNMKVDIKDWIEENVDLEKDFDYDEVYEALWVEDSVTGNGSGSYTFDREEAKEYVIDNMDLAKEAIEEFGIDAKTIGEKFLNEEWEWMDVTIRCNMLDWVLSEVLEELGINF